MPDIAELRDRSAQNLLGRLSVAAKLLSGNREFDQMTDRGGLAFALPIADRQEDMPIQPSLLNLLH